MDYTKSEVEQWLNDYNLINNNDQLTNDQFKKFASLYDQDGVDSYDNGDDLYEWMTETAEFLFSEITNNPN